MKSKLASLMIVAALLGGCNTFKKGRPKTPVVGERVSVLSTEADIAIDPATAAAPFNLPAATTNTEWTQPGGNAAKAMGNVALGTSLGTVFSVQAGAGTTPGERLAGTPVVLGERVFTIDTSSTVRAFNAQTGALIWATQFGTQRGNGRSLYGGGVAIGNGRVYATNGLGFVTALDQGNGGIVWTVRPGGPLRGSPSVSGDTLYVTSQDNQIYSLKAADGATNWSNAASLEIAGVFGVASPAVAQGTVVAGFSSGELNAYRYENGRVVWQDALSRTSISTSVANLSDIDASPVIDRGQVFAVGQGGRMVSLDLITGQRIWELNLAGITTPAVAGDWVFVVTSDAKLVCIARDTGKVRWINQLPSYEKAKAKKGPINYVGPILAGDRLIVGSSAGALISVDPSTGAFQNQISLGAGLGLAPVVANQTLYVLDSRGRLTALR
jgi:outer membrane protein assembly factor BamB